MFLLEERASWSQLRDELGVEVEVEVVVVVVVVVEVEAGAEKQIAVVAGNIVVADNIAEDNIVGCNNTAVDIDKIVEH